MNAMQKMIRVENNRVTIIPAMMDFGILVLCVRRSVVELKIYAVINANPNGSIMVVPTLLTNHQRIAKTIEDDIQNFLVKPKKRLSSFIAFAI
jgi:hypothetical protein